MIFRKTLFVWLAVTAFLPFAARAQTARWIAVRSPNFQLTGDADEAAMRRTVNRLEQFRFVFTQLFGGYKFDSPIPTTVIVFRDEATFKPFKPLDETGAPKDWVKGYFQSGRDANYIVLSADGEQADGFPTIFHEYVHFLLENTLGKSNLPPWLNEGFAEYYERMEIQKDGRVVIGAANPAHLALLRKNDLIPFEKFFALDNYALNHQSRENMVAFYAQAWAFIHFLMHGDGARSVQLEDFSKLVVAGKPAKQAFEAAFQTDYAAMEKELRKYLARRELPSSIKNFSASLNFENQTPAVAVSPAEAATFEGDLLRRADRRAEAENFLRSALALEPQLSFANAAFGFLKMDENDFGEAKKYLERAVRADSQNYLAHYGFAYVMSREGMSNFGYVPRYTNDEAETMRSSLRTAIALNPRFAESFHLFAFINIVRNENLDEGLAMIERALQIAPGNQWYLLRKAELLTRKHDFAAAREISRKIFLTAADDALKLYAQNALGIVNAWEAQLRDAADARRLDNEAVTEKPPTEEEIARLNAKAMLESLNQALRRTRTGERRISAYLTGIECSGGAVALTVKTGNQTAVLTGESFDDILFTSFEPGFAGKQIECGNLERARFAVITFRPATDDPAKIGGSVVAVEFVPENFVFLDLSQIKDRTNW